MKKNDLILIIIILALTAISVVGITVSRKMNKADVAYAVVTIDGNEYGRYPLDEDMVTTIELEDGSYNILEIHDGYAQISEASCRDQICVNHFPVHYSKEMIVCLPNRLVVEIVGGEENDVDGATN